MTTRTRCVLMIAAAFLLAGCASTSTTAPTMTGTNMAATSTPAVPSATPPSPPTRSGLALAARPDSMPKTAGGWTLEAHSDAARWHYHGPAHMTLSFVTGDLAAKLASASTVDTAQGIACVPTTAATDCYLPYPGGYVSVTGIDDAPTVRRFLIAWIAALN